MRRKVILSWSGGKDSSFALAVLRNDEYYEVVGLLTSITTGYDRVSIHGVRRELVEAQAAATGLPLFVMTLEPQSSNAAYNAAFLNALASLRVTMPEVTLIAFGDLFLADVRAFREQLLAGAGFQALFPLWGRDTTQLAADFINAGFRAILVCVDTRQLPASFAGRYFDSTLLVELPDGVDPCGEGGEFHTFVWAGPHFRDPVAVKIGGTILRDERFAYTELIPGKPLLGSSVL
jgi:uncharacterized protein (TIGR00290 family)